LEVHQAGEADANLYAYVSGGALRNVDPLGLEEEQGGFFSALWDSAQQGDFSPSSPIGQEIAHGDYTGSSVVQDDAKLEQLQDTALIVGVSAASGIGAAGIAAGAGAGAMTQGAVGAVVFGVSERGSQAEMNGADATEIAENALDPPAMLTDAAAGATFAGALEVGAPYVKELAARSVKAPAAPARATPDAAPTMVPQQVQQQQAQAAGGGQGTAKRFTSEQQALVDMAKADKKAGGITRRDMQAYKDLNNEAGAKGFADKGAVRGPEAHPLRSPNSKPGPGQQPHGHVGPVNHIPIKDVP
jgi:hypothetical protein